MSQKQSSAATAQSGLQGSAFGTPGQFIPTGGMGSIYGSDPLIDLIADSTAYIPDAKDCKKTCKSLCKPYRPIRKRKKNCKDPCRSDCTKGKNVIAIYP